MSRSYCTAPAEEQTVLEERERTRGEGQLRASGSGCSFFYFVKVVCKSSMRKL